MMYEKPKDIRYTDMCIYIDTHIYTDSYDESLVYQYLYHLLLMIASKSKLFNRSCYYDDFAIFGATRLYLRLTNKKQFEVDASGTPRMKKIRSILNYIHKVIYHFNSCAC